MNKSSSTSFRNSYEMPSVSALDNTLSFEENMKERAIQNLREIPLQLTDTPKRCVLRNSPIKKNDPITSAAKRNARKNAQIENMMCESPPINQYQQYDSNVSQTKQSPSQPQRQNNRYSTNKSKNYDSNKKGGTSSKSPKKRTDAYNEYVDNENYVNRNMMLLTQSAFNVNRDFDESNLYNGKLSQSAANKSEIQMVQSCASFSQKSNQTSKQSLSRERRGRQSRLKKDSDQSTMYKIQNLNNRAILGNSINTMNSCNLRDESVLMSSDNSIRKHIDHQINLRRLQLVEAFTQKIAAKKIQRVFRTFLLWQKIKRRTEMSVERKRRAKLQKILAAKIIVKHVKNWLSYKKGKQFRSYIISKIVFIQRWFKSQMLKIMIEKRINARAQIFSLFQGWKTRKIVNSLAKEIQDYVNCDEGYQKMRLKNHFLVLFDSVIKNNLWLTKNLFRLQRLQNLQSCVSARSAAKTPQKQKPSQQQLSNNVKRVNNSHVVDMKSRRPVPTKRDPRESSKEFEIAQSPLIKQQMIKKTERGQRNKSSNLVNQSATATQESKLTKITPQSQLGQISSKPLTNLEGTAKFNDLDQSINDTTTASNTMTKKSSNKNIQQRNSNYDSFSNITADTPTNFQGNAQLHKKCDSQQLSSNNMTLIKGQHLKNKYSQASGMNKESAISTNSANTQSVTPRSNSICPSSSQQIIKNNDLQNAKLSQRKSSMISQNATSKIDCWRQNNNLNNSSQVNLRDKSILLNTSAMASNNLNQADNSVDESLMLLSFNKSHTSTIDKNVIKHNKSLSVINKQKSIRNPSSLNSSFMNQMDHSFMMITQDKTQKTADISHQDQEILQYKKCLHDIESILDTIYEKGMQARVDQRQAIPLGQKMKMGQRFNKLVHELKEQFTVVSQVGSKK
ncbi:UNKNOWN [Stylonychia lemnae]|uniref:Uncharacterized protein n=1 Tax=Stylonychia lemnae TaxID=5949 RepID=A0A078ANG4_STYLE|nr:UNKNOWN [Stylonychia lemnae]|eukprot:CDW83456.1 UNKNOWN [Stylonychia lemnae]